MDRIRIAPEVAEALARGGPVVALETSVVAHGLPPGENLEAARRCAEAVRAAGAIPAAIGLVDGRVLVGMDAAELGRLGDPARRPAKAGTLLLIRISPLWQLDFLLAERWAIGPVKRSERLYLIERGIDHIWRIPLLFTVTAVSDNLFWRSDDHRFVFSIVNCQNHDD